MTYEKPQVEVLKFEDAGFMTSSIDYSNALSVLGNNCTGFDGDTHKFTCGTFGSYTSDNPPPNNTQVTIGNETYTYVYDYKGNHWKPHKGN